MSTDTNIHETVQKTYGGAHLAERLLENLGAAGYDLNRLTPADLIAFDELHIMGRVATMDLGRRVALNETMRVLDVGCGVGGPARTLAAGFGCHVNGVDLSEAFVRAATVLSRQVGLADRVAFHYANALRLPFGDETFDAVFLIHVSVNIVDKKALFLELHRVLKKGGRLVLWEICRGINAPVIFPVPWADGPAFSHLVGMDELIRSVGDCGYSLIHKENATDEAAQWVRARMTSKQKKDPRRSQLDLNMVLNEFRRKRINVSKNLLEGNIAILRAIAVKP